VKPKARQDKTLTSIPIFFRSVDWAEWWEEFFNAVAQDGSYKYATIKTFVFEKGRNKRQKDFLRWYLGPEVQEEEVPTGYERYKPQDWVAKRESGGWFTDENLKALTHGIRVRMNSLEALRECGNKLTLNSVARMEQLARQLDKSFAGRFFLPNLAWGENVQRANAYLQLHKQILSLIDHAQSMYARSHGIDFGNLDGFASLLTASMLHSQTSTDLKIKDRPAKVLETLTQMTLGKAATYGLALPKEMGEVIIDTEVDDQDHPKHKIKKVN
jgi:hypothetical protein